MAEAGAGSRILDFVSSVFRQKPSDKSDPYTLRPHSAEMIGLLPAEVVSAVRRIDELDEKTYTSLEDRVRELRELDGVIKSLSSR